MIEENLEIQTCKENCIFMDSHGEVYLTGHRVWLTGKPETMELGNEQGLFIKILLNMNLLHHTPIPWWSSGEKERWTSESDVPSSLIIGGAGLLTVIPCIYSALKCQSAYLESCFLQNIADWGIGLVFFSYHHYHFKIKL